MAISLCTEIEYKSIVGIEKSELPDFSVIIGENGSGKTQLLELIEKEGPNVGEGFSKAFLISSAFATRSPIGSQLDGTNALIKNVIKSHIKNNTYKPGPDSHRNILSIQRDPNNNRGYHAAKYIAAELGKPLDQLTQEDIDNCTLEISFLVEDNPLVFDIGLSICIFYSAMHHNSFARFQNENLNFTNDVLSDGEFEKKYPNPFTLFNDSLKILNLPYQLKECSLEDYVKNGYVPKLVNDKENISIDFSSLSGGEQKLLYLVNCVTSSFYRSDKVDKPDLILLDEFDSPLHPSMIKTLFHVIDEILINKLKFKVILTSHSPTTAALSPEGSLFLMDKESKPKQIKPITGSEGINRLLRGVPTVHVIPNLRRQVFVESQSDVDFYDAFYNLVPIEQLEGVKNLCFIPAGPQTGAGSSAVERIVTDLEQNGATTGFGLLDWDLKNEPRGRIFVNGFGERYAIENYVFDPLYLTAILLREKIFSSTELGMTKNVSSHLELKDADIEDLQRCFDFVGEVVEKKIRNQKKEPDESYFKKSESNYSNGKKAMIFNFFKLCQGHELESFIVEAFPRLNEYKKNSDQRLKQHFIKYAVSDFDKMLPNDLIETFIQIHNYKI